MKKGFVLLCMFGFCVTLFAQGSSEVKSVTSASPEMRALRSALLLAKYGYISYSAPAILGAADILVNVLPQSMSVKGVQTGQEGDLEKKIEKPKYTAENLLEEKLLADGTRMAVGDVAMLEWADQIKKSLQMRSRGAEGGPKYQMDTVGAKGTITYQIEFSANKLAEVLVSGDGDTILDLSIYDAKGNRIASDEGYSDDCYVSWLPKRKELFTITIKNRGGVHNQFEMATN